MFTNKPKTNSLVSPDTTQVWYQKAIKQITKLINLNTSLKEEIAIYQSYQNQFYDKMELKNAELNKINQQKTMIQQELVNVIEQRNNLTKENQQLKKSIHKLKVNENSKSHISERKISTQVLKQSLGNIELYRKLADANSFIDKINQQNADLKQKLQKNDQNQHKLLNVKSMEIINKIAYQASPKNIFNSFQKTRSSQEVLKRVRKLQQQNKKLLKKIQHHKNLTVRLTQQNHFFKKQNTKFKAQITSYQNLFLRQQDIIQNLHQEYETDINKMTQQFKKKLIDQRESFSPAMGAKHLKDIEGLQHQNKALKKKFQLCSIQLTKCFKTLQIYKEKLHQCQKDYEQLLIDRQQLLQRLQRFQTMHRQKSNKSFGSASRNIFFENER